jgi:hypothetical protein
MPMGSAWEAELFRPPLPGLFGLSLRDALDRLGEALVLLRQVGPVGTILIPSALS